MKKAIIFALIFCVSAAYIFAQNTQVCRTPGGNRLIVLEPCAYDVGDYSSPLATLSIDQGYSYDELIQSNSPGLFPTITLQDFIDEMTYTDIGVFYFDTHAGLGLISVECYEFSPQGLAECQSAQTDYIASGIDASYITIGVNGSNAAYSICVTPAGLQHWCTHLDQSIVYVKACESSGLNQDWKALIALGYDTEISGYAGADRFFKRMDGILDRGPDNSNSNRSILDAMKGIQHLVASGNRNVVISPIVLDHQPENYGLVTEGQTGYVNFDCEMDISSDASSVVFVTGNVGQLQNVTWVNNHRIEYTVTNLVPFSHIDFRVDAQAALSAYNQKSLDGNCNPDQHNGVGPNGDFYNWISLTSPYAIMDFENGSDGDVIQSTIPGMQFITTAGYDWVYGDKRTNMYNIYPYGSAVYWCDGNLFAWLGPNQGNGRINFTGATATSVSLGTSANSGLYLEAYDENDNLLDYDHVGENLSTNILSTVTVTGAGIDHVLIHDGGNYWLIDNLCVVDLLQQTLILLPANLAVILQKLETINPGATNSFIVNVNGLTKKLELVLNWLSGKKGKTPGQFQVTITRPDNTIYQQFTSSSAPASLEILNPPVGYWKVDVKALQTPKNDFPIALVIGQEKTSLTDIYLSTADILLSSTTINHVSDLLIPVILHSSTSSDPLSYVRVRCFLDQPGSGGTQIDNDAFWLNEIPGATDTVYFNLGTYGLQGIHDIYVVIDPDKELSEQNITNNVASKKLTFLSVDEKNEPVVSLLPNPNDGTFIIEIKPMDSPGRLKIINNVGNTVYAENVPKSSGFYRTVTMKSLPEGIYYLNIQFEKSSLIKKFIIKKETD